MSMLYISVTVEKLNDRGLIPKQGCNKTDRLDGIHTKVNTSDVTTGHWQQ
jgi:hypothetical protein